MNNGVNNSEIKIEPVETPNVATPEQQAPTVQPSQAPVEPPKENVEQTLGANVKIAPVQPMYDENDRIINQPQPVQPKPTPTPQPTTQQPIVLQQPTPTTPGVPPQVQFKQTPGEEQVVNQENNDTKVVTKKRLSLTPLFLIIIIGLIAGLFYLYNDKQRTVEQITYQNMLTTTNDQEIELDKESTLVKDLYNKVATTVKEDIANPNLDDEMRRYLAYRQINPKNIYESNCNLFNQTKMYYYTCNMQTYKPNAFKEETLQLEIKKLFGEDTTVANDNIQLGRQCIGGYQYIGERGEYVQGQCTENGAVTIKVNKTVIKATKYNDEITIEEETNYISENKESIPEYLKDGIYVYKFKLDTNYNYVYISKDFRTKY